MAAGIYNKVIKQHEIVVPRYPLPVWYYVFHNEKFSTYVAPHWHRGIELSFVVQGKIDEFLIAHKRYSSHGGKILVVNTQEIHSINDHPTSKDLALSIIFPYDYVNRFYPAITHRIIVINDLNKLSTQQKMVYLQLQGLLTEFTELYFIDTPTKILRQLNLVNQVLFLLVNNFTQEKPTEDQIGQRQVYVTNRLQQITQYVNNHYQEHINLEDIAQDSNITKEYLSRFFKKQMAMTVDTYLNNVRSQHAHTELLTKKVSLTQIALNNGFSGLRTMNRAFKNLYNKSASEMKKELKK